MKFLFCPQCNVRVEVPKSVSYEVKCPFCDKPLQTQTKSPQVFGI